MLRFRHTNNNHLKNNTMETTIKATIEIDESNLSGIRFERDNTHVNPSDLTDEEKIRITEALASYYRLFSTFVQQ